MHYMRHVNAKMHMSDRCLPAGKQHRVFFYKTLHQMFRPGKVIDQLGSMIKYIEQEDPPACRAPADHINVFAKSFVIVSFIDRGIRIAFYIIVERHPFSPTRLLK